MGKQTHEHHAFTWTDLLATLGLILAVLVLVGVGHQWLKLAAWLLVVCAFPLAWHTMAINWEQYRANQSLRRWEREMSEDRRIR